MTATPDPQHVDLVLSNLKREVEAKRPEPFVITLPSSQRVVFRYPLVYKRHERKTWQDLIVKALREYDDQPLLERMLSKEDLAKYDAEDLDDDVHIAVLDAVSTHFGFKRELEEEGKGDDSGVL